MKAFQKLPGIGPKSAARMAYHFLSAPEEMSMDLAKALVKMKKSIVTCNVCFNVSDTDPCVICEDNGRDHAQVCVVESPLDVVAIEKSGVYNGIYHVLGGVISPADGIGPEHIRTKELRRRIMNSFEKDSDNEKISQEEAVTGNADGTTVDADGTTVDAKKSESSHKGEKILEVIVATNPSLEGEATSAYIAEMVKKINKDLSYDQDMSETKIKVSRLAMGLPTGADLEYADRLTLKRALEGRTNM